MRYFIDSCRYGDASGDEIEPAFIASVQYHTDEDETSKWLTNVQFTDIPNFYLTDVDPFDKLIAGNSLEAGFINDFQGMPLTDNYLDFFDYFKSHPDDESGRLIHFLVAVSLLDDETETEKLAKAGMDHWVDAIDIPVTEYERDLNS